MPTGVYKRTKEHIRNLADSIRGTKRSKKQLKEV